MTIDVSGLASAKSSTLSVKSTQACPNAAYGGVEPMSLEAHELRVSVDVAFDQRVRLQALHS